MMMMEHNGAGSVVHQNTCTRVQWCNGIKGSCKSCCWKTKVAYVQNCVQACIPARRCCETSGLLIVPRLVPSRWKYSSLQITNLNFMQPTKREQGFQSPCREIIGLVGKERVEVEVDGEGKDLWGRGQGVGYGISMWLLWYIVDRPYIVEILKTCPALQQLQRND